MSVNILCQISVKLGMYPCPLVVYCAKIRHCYEINHFYRAAWNADAV